MTPLFPSLVAQLISVRSVVQGPSVWLRRWRWINLLRYSHLSHQANRPPGSSPVPLQHGPQRPHRTDRTDSTNQHPGYVEPRTLSAVQRHRRRGAPLSVFPSAVESVWLLEHGTRTSQRRETYLTRLSSKRAEVIARETQALNLGDLVPEGSRSECLALNNLSIRESHGRENTLGDSVNTERLGVSEFW